MGEIRIGTTSWSEKTLLESGRFYPPGVRTAEARLRYYASRFDLVEVDSLYYRLPDPRSAALWAARTPRGFVFDVKAFRLFTQHRTPAAALPPDVRAALGPLARENLYYRDLPAEIVRELWRPERTLARTLAFERRSGLTHVVVDEPQGFPNSVPPVWTATSDLATVRLHGRNRRTWNARGLASAAERFNYRYSDDELAGFVEPVRNLAGATRRVHVLFNNCYRDYAQQNATTFARMIAL